MTLHQALIRDADATGYNNHQQGARRAFPDAFLGTDASPSGHRATSQLYRVSSPGEFPLAPCLVLPRHTRR